MQATRPLGLAAMLGFFVASSSWTCAQNLTSLGTHSVITRGDFSTNSNVEGRTIVGGNLTGSNSSDFGTKLQGKISKSNYTVQVAGNISAGNPINLNSGSIELGGSLNNRKVNFNGGGSLSANPGVSYDPIFDELTLASATLSTFKADSTAIIPSGQPGPFIFNATPGNDQMAVFLINNDSLFNNSKVQQIDAYTNAVTDILVNVSGTHIDWQHGNLVGAFNAANSSVNFIWNFYEATSINFGSRNMRGNVLAPFATVRAQGVIDGSIFANSLITQSEVHLPGYHGNLIPEPSCLSLAAIGALALFRRRRPVG